MSINADADADEDMKKKLRMRMSDGNILADADYFFLYFNNVYFKIISS